MKNNGSVKKIRPPLKKNIIIFLVYLALISTAIYLPCYYFVVNGVPLCGNIIYSDGNARVFHNTDRGTKDDSLKVGTGDIIVTEKTGRTSVSFDNLISIRLARHTELEFNRINRQISNPIQLLEGKSTNLFAAGGQLNLHKGRIWIDKSAGAPFILRAGEILITPGKAAFDISLTPRSETRISVYRGNVRVSVIGSNVFNTVIFPGKECLMVKGKCISIHALRYHSDDIWQNWNMALSYIAPPRSAGKLAAIKAETRRAAASGNSADKSGNTGIRKQGKEERTDPLSFKRWIEERTKGGKDPYPKYTPSGSSISKLAFTEFPESSSTDTGSDLFEDGSSYPPHYESSESSSHPPRLPGSAIKSEAPSKKYAEPYSFEKWVHERTRGGKDPYPKYTPPSSRGNASTQDEGSELPYPSITAQPSPQKCQKVKEEEDSAASWFPFLKDEDSVPPPPPSLNN